MSRAKDEHWDAMMMAQMPQEYLDALYKRAYDHGYKVGYDLARFDKALEERDRAQAKVNEILGNSETAVKDPVRAAGDNSVRDMPSGLSARLCSSSETPVHQD